MICSEKGANNALFGTRFKPRSNFSTGHQSLGKLAVDNPACASPGDDTGQVICAGNGTDNSLYGIRFRP